MYFFSQKRLYENLWIFVRITGFIPSTTIGFFLQNFDRTCSRIRKNRNFMIFDKTIRSIFFKLGTRLIKRFGTFLFEFEISWRNMSYSFLVKNFFRNLVLLPKNCNKFSRNSKNWLSVELQCNLVIGANFEKSFSPKMKKTCFSNLSQI